MLVKDNLVLLKVKSELNQWFMYEPNKLAIFRQSILCLQYRGYFCMQYPVTIPTIVLYRN